MALNPKHEGYKLPQMVLLYFEAPFSSKNTHKECGYQRIWFMKL